MTSNKKPDADAIIAHIDLIKSQPWLAPSQLWWPEHLFHFTDITNAVNILKEETLFSRSELEKREALVTDIASPEIISKTRSEWKDYVRLYFRPRTPMQYNIEGFRPLGRRQYGGAHCPVPIVFIFDSKGPLTDKKTQFSNGNLATDGVIVGETYDFFSIIPFQKVFHNGSLWGFSYGQQRDIVFHRHAEVIIPQSLDLTNLKLIWCRSQAEFETLIYLLPVRIKQKWLRKIGVGNKPLLFNSEWPFVEKATLSKSDVSFAFNPSQISGPFHLRLIVDQKDAETVYSYEQKDFYAKGSISFTLSDIDYSEDYIVEFRLDGQLAYKNRYLDKLEVPF